MLDYDYLTKIEEDLEKFAQNNQGFLEKYYGLNNTNFIKENAKNVELP